MFDLVIQTGKHQGTRLLLPLDKPVLLGRDESCQMTLASALVSRKHCELIHTSLGISVRDLQSQNGTYINDVVVDVPTVMQVGDLLRVGACVFEVQPAQARPEPARPDPSDQRKESPVARSNSESSPPTKPRKVGHVSDDDISDWLTDQDTVTDFRAANTGDTAIISGGNRPQPQVAQTQAVQNAVPVAKARKFRSVKEEAADIIRRHWQKIRGE